MKKNFEHIERRNRIFMPYTSNGLFIAFAKNQGNRMEQLAALIILEKAYL